MQNKAARLSPSSLLGRASVICLIEAPSSSQTAPTGQEPFIRAHAPSSRGRSVRPTARPRGQRRGSPTRPPARSACALLRRRHHPGKRGSASIKKRCRRRFSRSSRAAGFAPLARLFPVPFLPTVFWFGRLLKHALRSRGRHARVHLSLRVAVAGAKEIRRQTERECCLVLARSLAFERGWSR